MREGFENMELIKIIYKHSVFTEQKHTLYPLQEQQVRGFGLKGTDRDSKLDTCRVREEGTKTDLLTVATSILL
jgi:hypothetical protein